MSCEVGKTVAMVHTGTMVAAHKSPELAAQEDLQNAISQHKDAIQLALRRYTRLLILPSTPCPLFSNISMRTASSSMFLGRY